MPSAAGSTAGFGLRPLEDRDDLGLAVALGGSSAPARFGAVPVELGEEGRRVGPVGEDGDAVAAAGDGDVQDATLLLDVVGEAVGHDAVGTTPNTTTRSHSRPLTRWTVDSVTPAGVGLAAEQPTQPRLEPGRVGVEVGHAEEAFEVVEVARPLAAAGAVEHAHGRAEADVVAHRSSTERVVPRRRRPPRGEVVGEAEDLGRLLVRHLVGDGAQALGRPAGPPRRAGRGTTAAAPGWAGA